MLRVELVQRPVQLLLVFLLVLQVVGELLNLHPQEAQVVLQHGLLVG